MNFQDVINNVNSIVSIISFLFKFLCSYFNKSKIKQDFIDETMKFKSDTNLDLIDLDVNSRKNDYFVIEEDYDEQLRPDKETQIKNIKLKRAELNIDEGYEKLDLDNYLPSYINFLSCNCRKKKKDSITNVLRTVYEYYDSIIDITKILIKLHHIENFIKSKATSSIKNLKHKKILLKINRKMLPIIEKSNLISTFKIRRNNF